MKKQAFLTLLLLVSLLVGVFGTAAAQTGDEPTATATTEPTATPVPDEEQPGYRFWTHPVVSILSAYFDREIADETDDETTPEQEGTAVPDDGTLPEDDDVIGEIGKEIAAYHEAGMGFGVLVKIYSMAEESRLACDKENAAAPAPAEGAPAEGEQVVDACVPLTADELVAAFKGGTGMGQLMKAYGKPAMLGVGHVKKAIKNLDANGIDTEELAKVKKLKAPKVKPLKAPKVKGPKK